MLKRWKESDYPIDTDAYFDGMAIMLQSVQAIF